MPLHYPAVTASGTRKIGNLLSTAMRLPAGSCLKEHSDSQITSCGNPKIIHRVSGSNCFTDPNRLLPTTRPCLCGLDRISKSWVNFWIAPSRLLRGRRHIPSLELGKSLFELARLCFQLGREYSLDLLVKLPKLIERHPFQFLSIYHLSTPEESIDLNLAREKGHSEAGAIVNARFAKHSQINKCEC